MGGIPRAKELSSGEVNGDYPRGSSATPEGLEGHGQQHDNDVDRAGEK